MTLKSCCILKAVVVAAVLCTADAVQVGVKVNPQARDRPAPRRKAALAAVVGMLASLNGAHGFQVPPPGGLAAGFQNLPAKFHGSKMLQAHPNWHEVDDGEPADHEYKCMHPSCLRAYRNALNGRHLKPSKFETSSTKGVWYIRLLDWLLYRQTCEKYLRDHRHDSNGVDDLDLMELLDNLDLMDQPDDAK